MLIVITLESILSVLELGLKSTNLLFFISLSMFFSRATKERIVHPVRALLGWARLITVICQHVMVAFMLSLQATLHFRVVLKTKENVMVKIQQGVERSENIEYLHKSGKQSRKDLRTVFIVQIYRGCLQWIPNG